MLRSSTRVSSAWRAKAAAEGSQPALRRQRQQSKDNINKHIKMAHRSTRWVKFNVGGQRFSTSRITLARDKNSFLYRLCHDEEQPTTEPLNLVSLFVDSSTSLLLELLLLLRSPLSIESSHFETEFSATRAMKTANSVLSELPPAMRLRR